MYKGLFLKMVIGGIYGAEEQKEEKCGESCFHVVRVFGLTLLL